MTETLVLERIIQVAKTYKFSTYATSWIRQAITRAVADHMRVIHLPVHMVEKINRLIRINSRLLQELGREPTLGEVAKELALPAERVQEIIMYSQELKSLEMTDTVHCKRWVKC